MKIWLRISIQTGKRKVWNSFSFLICQICWESARLFSHFIILLVRNLIVNNVHSLSSQIHCTKEREREREKRRPEAADSVRRRQMNKIITKKIGIQHFNGKLSYSRSTQRIGRNGVRVHSISMIPYKVYTISRDKNCAHFCAYFVIELPTAYFWDWYI